MELRLSHLLKESHTFGEDEIVLLRLTDHHLSVDSRDSEFVTEYFIPIIPANRRPGNPLMVLQCTFFPFVESRPHTLCGI